jgi:hypothetical protein
MTKTKKTIVTHHNPDLDAAGAVWLVKRFWPGWEKAEVKFVPAGERLKSPPPSQSPVIHVDTGMGRFDHHQTDAPTCATKLVYEEVVKNWPKKADEALARLVRLITDIDHFQEIFWPEPAADRYDLMLHRILDGWRGEAADDEKNLDRVLDALDGVYRVLRDKVWAEKELEEKGVAFETGWGSAVGVETINDEVITLAQQQGHALAIRKDPRKGYVRIKSLPNDEIDLTPIYERLKELDPQASWFLHSSRHILLNGSTHSPRMKPTKLSLDEVIAVVKKEGGLANSSSRKLKVP